VGLAAVKKKTRDYTMSDKLVPEPERLYPTVSYRSDKPKKTKLKVYIRDAREAARSLFFSRIRQCYDGQKRGSGQKVAIYVHYASSRRVSKMVEKQIETYSALGFDIIFVSVCRKLPQSEINRLRKACHSVIIRRNVGLDFGAWRDIISEKIVNLDIADELLLVNDSVLGPIRPIEPLLDMMRCREGLWGLTNSRDFASHLQSYFLLARGRKAIEAVCEFMKTVLISHDKATVIQQGELGITQSVARKGVPVYSLFGLDQLISVAMEDTRYRRELALALGFELDNDEEITPNTKLALHRAILKLSLNPTHHFAEPLVRIFDFPFIKKDLVVANPCGMTIGADWRSLLDETSPSSADLLIDHLCHFSYGD
jgi:hypothetical protein